MAIDTPLRSTTAPLVRPIPQVQQEIQFWDTISVACLGLPHRGINVLGRNGILTVGKLVNLTSKQFTELFSKNSAVGEKLVEALTNLGFEKRGGRWAYVLPISNDHKLKLQDKYTTEILKAEEEEYPDEVKLVKAKSVDYRQDEIYLSKGNGSSRTYVTKSELVRLRNQIDLMLKS